MVEMKERSGLYPEVTGKLPQPHQKVVVMGQLLVLSAQETPRNMPHRKASRRPDIQ